MKKDLYYCVLMMFASNQDQKDYAFGLTQERLLKKKIVKLNENGTIELTEKTIKKLKKCFGISFEGE